MIGEYRVNIDGMTLFKEAPPSLEDLQVVAGMALPEVDFGGSRQSWVRERLGLGQKAALGALVALGLVGLASRADILPAVQAAPADDGRNRAEWVDPEAGKLMGDGDGDPPDNPMAGVLGGSVANESGSGNQPGGVSDLSLAQENFVNFMKGGDDLDFSPDHQVVRPEIPLANPWGEEVADHYPVVDPSQLYCEVDQCDFPDYAQTALDRASAHVLAKGYLASEINISQGTYPEGNQAVTFAVVKIPGEGNLVLWNGGVDSEGNLHYGDYPDMPGIELASVDDGRLLELWLPEGVTLGQEEIDGTAKLMLVDESSGQPIGGLRKLAKIVGVGEGKDDMIPNLFLIDDQGVAHPDVLLEIVYHEDGNWVIQVEGNLEARFDVENNSWVNLDLVLSTDVTSAEGSVPAELGAMGISFDGEFYHGTMPDGREFNAVMVENESGVGLVDKINHFVAAAIDENGQWEQVGLYIGRMVTTAEAESAQTINLEQVWDGSYARWCDLVFGVENRTTSKDLSNIVDSNLNRDIINWVKYGDEGDVFEVKDVKSLGNGMWLFNVRAGIGNGFVESVNLMGPVFDTDSLVMMMGMRQGTFSMMILSRLEVDADVGELGNLGSLMQEIWNQQNELFGDSISQGLVNIEELEHGALKNVVIPVTNVLW